MSKLPIVQKIERKQIKKSVPHFSVGDTVCVFTKIIEGEKERIQKFTGTVIARKGTGISETFTVYRVAYGEGMERVFPLHSPRVAQIEVMRHGKVRRAKLNYLKGATGKAAKVPSHHRAKIIDKKKIVEASQPEETFQEDVIAPETIKESTGAGATTE